MDTSSKKNTIKGRTTSPNSNANPISTPRATAADFDAEDHPTGATNASYMKKEDSADRVKMSADFANNFNNLKDLNMGTELDGIDEESSSDELWNALDAFLYAANASLMALLNVLKYDGFSPREFIAAFIRKGLKLNKAIGTVMADASILLMYAMQQGTTANARQVARVMSLEAQRTIITLLREYDVRDGVENVNNRRANGSSAADTITLGRFLAAMPHISSKMLASGKINPIVKSSLIPLHLQHANGAAMIPSTSDYDPMFANYVKWAVSLTKTLSRKNKKYKDKTEAEILEETEMWSALARKSNAVSDLERYSFMTLYAPDHLVRNAAFDKQIADNKSI